MAKEKIIKSEEELTGVAEVAEIVDVVDVEEVDVFLNPFDAGVSYVDFLKSVPEGVTVEDHCKGKLTEEELAWIILELGNL